MQTTNTQIEQYQISHHRFIESYKQINEYVAELYRLPRKLVEDAGRALDTCCRESSVPHARDNGHISCEEVIDFMDQLDEFTLQTIQLFNEHRKHVDQTRRYIRKVSVLKSRYGKNAVTAPEELNDLIPDLLDLLSGLRLIKKRADVMIKNMEILARRWEAIKCVMNQ